MAPTVAISASSTKQGAARGGHRAEVTDAKHSTRANLRFFVIDSACQNGATSRMAMERFVACLLWRARGAPPRPGATAART